MLGNRPAVPAVSFPAGNPLDSAVDPEIKARRFEQVIMPHLDAAYNLARWLTRNDSDAQDVVQEACMRVFKYFDGFEGENPSAWLLAIVRNSCFTWIHRNRPSEEVAGSDSITDETTALGASILGTNSRELLSNPETLLIDSRDRTRINQLVERLPAQYREVIVLREIEDLSYREIADVIGIPIG